jgi:RNA polymerase sigma factor (sigma-70 family)
MCIYSVFPGKCISQTEFTALTSNPQITQLLVDWSAGNAKALDTMMPLVYGELRRMAARHMRQERDGHTLQTTGLVHEAFIRLIDQSGVRWQSRSHFFSIASHLMRRILVDGARARLAAKRGEGRANVSLDELAELPHIDGEGDLLAEQVIGPSWQVSCGEVVGIDAALARLESLDARQSQIVELRFFGGLTIEETANVLEISNATVKRDWSMARAWLARELTDTEGLR